MTLLYLSMREFLVCSVVTLILVITCIDFLRKIKFGRRHATNIPVLPYLPLIGSIYTFLMKDPLNKAIDICKDYKSFYFWAFTKPYYVTCDPDELQIILTHQDSIEKGSIYSKIESVIRESIVLNSASVWRKKRKIISKIFKHNVLNTFIPSFNDLSDEYIQSIENEETSADLVHKNSDFFFEIFFHNFLKVDTNDKLNKIHRKFNIQEATKLVMTSIFQRSINPLFYFDCIYKLTSTGNKMFSRKEQATNYVTEMIHSRRQKRMDPGYSEEIDGPSLIDLVDESDTDIEIMVSDISFIYAAAGETSGRVLTYAMAILGLYKDIQEKVYEEVIGATGNDGMIDSTALYKLNYTKMVLLETMRMFSPVPMIMRQVTEDLDLKGTIIPKGTDIVIQLMALHRNEQHWKDPMRFDPDRFSTEEVKNRHPYSYAPFSAGPRNCIGWKYANMVGTTLLGKIVRKYEISSNMKSVENIKFDSLVLVNVPDDIRIKFTPRNN